MESDGPDSCDKPGLIEKLHSNDTAHETLVMDAVLAFAHALNSMRQDLCPNTAGGICEEMEYIDGTDLRDYILRTSFTSLAGKRVWFRPNGDTPGRYEIRYFQKRSSDWTYAFKRVGKWDEDSNRKTVIYEDVPWYLWHEGLNPGEVPKSICSEPCGKGERINVDIENLCCWTCSRCYNHEIVTRNGTECKSCIDEGNDLFQWPNNNFTECVHLKVAENVWSYAVISASVVGLILTVVVIVLYTNNHENALIKASSRELSYIMFVGKLCIYIGDFAIFAFERT